MIFPDWGKETAAHETQKLPLYTDWAVDWDKGCFALRNGEMYTVSGTEAVKVWARCALHPDSRRFECSAHGADYGNRLCDFLGQGGDGIWRSRVRREIRETLSTFPYVVAVDGFSFAARGSAVTVAFTVKTVYESYTDTMEVPIK